MITYRDPSIFELKDLLNITYSDLDEYLYQHVPVDTINQIINKKTIYDKFLKRMVPSIFDPVSQKHQYDDFEKKIIAINKYS